MAIQYISPIKLNLEKNRPNVLLFGNGFFHENMDWKSLLQRCAKDGIENNEFDELIKTDYLLFADAALDTSDSDRREKYIRQISQSDYVGEQAQELMGLLSEVPFDAVVTTNYTYQIERCIDSNFKPDTKNGYVHQIGKKSVKITKTENSTDEHGRDAVRLLHTFNRVSNDSGYVDVWHPHGELRRRSSLVLSHDAYGRLVRELVRYNDKRRRMRRSDGDVELSSWFDYLLYGNVYILGFSASYAEFDFWWLLNRRKREKDRSLIGKYYFYEPLSEANEAKRLLLSKMDVEFLNLDAVFTRKTKDYTMFYKKAIADICSRINAERTKEADHE